MVRKSNSRGVTLRIATLMMLLAVIMVIAFAGVVNAKPGQKDGAIKTISSSQILYENFESGWGSWSADNGVWGVGIPTAGPNKCHGGSNCAGTNISGNYPPDTDSRLISPSVQLPAVGAGEEMHLRFWHWFSYAANDQGWVQVSVYNTSTGLWGDWQNVGTAITVDSQYWSVADRDITQFSGKKIRIAFYHTASSYPWGESSTGWYIDDVGITKSVPVFTGNFESGWGSWSADNGVWGVGIPTAGPSKCHGGSNCAGTNISGNYQPDTDSRLISPSVRIPALSADDEIHLRFWHWFSYAANDQGWVQVSVYNASTGLWGDWQNVGTAITGSSPYWSVADRDLTKFSGKKIRIAFYHTASSYPWGESSTGWYIDDITINYPHITVASPNGGENWQAGTKQVIKWSFSGNLGPNVKIELLKGGILNRTINSSVPINKGSYNWTIPSNQKTGTNYRMRITSTTNTFYTDSSNSNFTISSQPFVCNTSTIWGYSFNDTNGNKTKEKGEAGLSNWTINLKGYDTCKGVLVTRTIKTNSTGYFAFKSTNPGFYALSEDFVLGWLPTTDVAYTISVPSSSKTIRRDFGNRKFVK